MNLAQRIYEYIKHGDEDHRAWLKQALVEFFEAEEQDRLVGRIRSSHMEDKEEDDKESTGRT